MLGVRDSHWRPVSSELRWTEGIARENEEPALFLPGAGGRYEYRSGDEPSFAPLVDFRKRLSARFFTFSECSTDERLLEFAHEFGYLGVPEVFAHSVEVAGIEYSQGEHIDTWRDQSELMSLAVRAWRFAAQEDATGMRSLFEVRDWDVEENWRLLQIVLPKRRATTSYWPTGMQFPFEGDLTDEKLLSTGFGLCRDLVDYSIRKYTQLSLVTTGPVTAELEIVPTCLTGAMWLQLARAIEGDKEYRKCKRPGCGRYFDLDSGRSDSKFCSNACKSKDQRAKAGR